MKGSATVVLFFAGLALGVGVTTLMWSGMVSRAQGKNMSKTIEQISEEIQALKRLAASVPDDAISQASIAGQINALKWACNFLDA